MIFVFDEMLGAKFVQILRLCGQRDILTCHDRFNGIGTDDAVILATLGSTGDVLFTIDHGMYATPELRRDLVLTNATIVFLPRKLSNTPIYEKVIWLLRFWRKVRHITFEAGRCYAATLNFQLNHLEITERSVRRRRRMIAPQRTVSAAGHK